MANKIKCFADEAQCAMLRDTVDRAIAEDTIKIWRDDEGSDIRIYNAERKVPEFSPLYDAMVAHYTSERGVAPKHSFLMVNRLIPMEGNLGSGGGWHRDTWLRQYKIFVFLSDVGEANGPFEYIPGSNRWSAKLKDLIRYRRSLRVPAGHVRGESVLLTVSAGEGTYFDTTTLHRGSPIREGARYAATLYAFDTSGEKLRRSKERFDVM